MKKPIVVTGCGRSGTTYITELFDKVGIEIGHERRKKHGISSWHIVTNQWVALEKSFFSPKLLLMRSPLVLHQVRNPLKTIPSIATFNSRSWKIISRYTSVTPKDDPLVKAAKYYVEWNLMAERFAHYRYRIEDIATTFPKIMEMIDPSIKWDREVLAQVSSKSNARHHEEVSTQNLADALPGALFKAVLGLAEKYGYRKEVATH